MLSEEEVLCYLLGLRQRGVARGYVPDQQVRPSLFLSLHTLERTGCSGKKRIASHDRNAAACRMVLLSATGMSVWGLFGGKRIASPRQKRLPDGLSGLDPATARGIRANPGSQDLPRRCVCVCLRISEATTLEVGAIDRANQVLRIVGSRPAMAAPPPGGAGDPSSSGMPVHPSQPLLVVPQSTRRRTGQQTGAVRHLRCRRPGRGDLCAG